MYQYDDLFSPIYWRSFLYFVLDLQQGTITTSYVCSSLQIVDIFLKAHTTNIKQFHKYINGLNINNVKMSHPQRKSWQLLKQMSQVLTFNRQWVTLRCNNTKIYLKLLQIERIKFPGTERNIAIVTKNCQAIRNKQGTS